MCVCVCVCACVRACVCVGGGGYQQPVHAGVCGVMCVRGKKENEKTKNRDSLARKSHFK